MAKRRALARALSGLGEGIGNYSTHMFRQSQQEKMQDRYDTRAAENQKAMDARAASAQVAAAERAIDEKVSLGLLDPPQAEAMKQRLRGNAASSEDIRPSPQRRMAKGIGEGINAATTPEMVDSPESIFAKSEAMGVPSRLPAEWSEGMIPAENDPYQNATPLVRQYGELAGAKRRSLSDADTELIESKDPTTGATSKRRIPKRSPELAAGITTGPTAAQAGALEGAQAVAKLEVAGDAEVEQGAKVTGANTAARQAVENSPAAVAARIREAVNKEVATLQATMPLRLKEASAKAAIEISQGVNKENAQQTATASRAAAELAPFYARVSELTKALNNKEGVAARVKGVIKQGQSYMGGAPEVIELDQLIAQNARKLAIAMGVREANVSEKETEQALKGIGLRAWSSATERRNALRNLNDLITLAPVVAARSGSFASVGERMQLAQGLMQQRRDAEQGAIKAGVDLYIDPVLGTVVKVIQ